jgi:hypothetical protein
MAKNLLHYADVHALLDQQRGGSMPCVVDPGRSGHVEGQSRTDSQADSARFVFPYIAPIATPRSRGEVIGANVGVGATECLPFVILEAAD